MGFLLRSDTCLASDKAALEGTTGCSWMQPGMRALNNIATRSDLGARGHGGLRGPQADCSATWTH